jgi:hypothetical protein
MILLRLHPDLHTKLSINLQLFVNHYVLIWDVISAIPTESISSSIAIAPRLSCLPFLSTVVLGSLSCAMLHALCAMPFNELRILPCSASPKACPELAERVTHNDCSALSLFVLLLRYALCVPLAVSRCASRLTPNDIFAMRHALCAMRAIERGRSLPGCF